MKPEDMLPDGVEGITQSGRYVRKGTIGAFIVNVLNMENADPESEAFQEGAKQIQSLLPGLQALRVFDVFTVKSEPIRQWMEKEIAALDSL